MLQANNYDISYIDFIHQILVPETGVLLAQAYMGLSCQGAITILQVSKDYSLAFYPQDKSTNGDTVLHDLRAQWTVDKVAQMIKMKCEEPVMDLTKEEPVETELLHLTEATIEYPAELVGD